MSNQFLDLELRVLILRHGRSRIIDSLAKLGDQTPEEVERELAAARAIKAQRAQKPQPQPVSSLVKEACRNRPEVLDFVTTLINRFENRAFLPQRRDVIRFLDRLGAPHGKLKSRRQFAAPIVTALAGLDVQELERLAASPQADASSDLAVLAREIMSGGRARRPSKDKPQ